MSSQFNYELDERQIRILMQNTELTYDESAWRKFSSLPEEEHRQSLAVMLPKISFGISRSVIVPVFFILMIGGLSSLLFSFVDFKKKEEVIKEIPYIKPVPNKKIITPKPTISKPITIVTLTTEIAVPIETVALIPIDKSITNKKEEPTKNIVETVVSKETIVSENERKNENSTIVTKKKKKRRKNITEELPTINATSTNLNEGVKEPELDIK